MWRDKRLAKYVRFGYLGILFHIFYYCYYGSLYWGLWYIQVCLIKVPQYHRCWHSIQAQDNGCTLLIEKFQLIIPKGDQSWIWGWLNLFLTPLRYHYSCLISLDQHIMTVLFISSRATLGCIYTWVERKTDHKGKVSFPRTWHNDLKD